MNARARPGDGEAGFTLVETLVAAAIIAAMLGVTYEASASGARAAREMRDRRSAVLIAQSKLAEVGATIPLTTGISSGRDGNDTWRVEIARYGERNARDSGPPLLAVDVTVARDDEPRPLLRLRTLRLGA